MSRNTRISLFVVLWLAVFHYESLRLNYLRPWLGFEPPKVKFLFPPAGWIMFYRIDDADGRAEVYGIKNGRPELIDPHRIFETRWVGYDNIHRNILISVLHPAQAEDFCGYLQRKFPEYEGFAVTEAWIPSLTKDPRKKLHAIVYRC